MQVFRYKGYDPHGKKVDGEVSALSVDEAERRVAAQDVTIIAIIPAGARKGASQELEGAPPTVKKKTSDADGATLLRDLAVMAETGVPLVEALDALTASTRHAHIRAGLKRLKSEIVGGKGLSVGMRASGLFPAVVSDMVKVAEEGGRLDRALNSAATYMERVAELRKKVMNAMLYPAVLTSIAFLTIVVLVVFVLPRFADIFVRMRAQIPQSTQFLLNLSGFIRSNPLVVLGMLAGVVFGLKFVLALPPVRAGMARAILRTPVLGELVKRLALSRALASIATLVNSNVSLMAALEHGARVSGNPLIHDALMRARVGVEHGAPLSDSLADSKLFPPTLVQMVQVGEKSGRLGPLMQNMAAHMENDVDARLKSLISIVEPLMIVVMGTVVGGITLSVIIPLYSVVENIK